MGATQFNPMQPATAQQPAQFMPAQPAQPATEQPAQQGSLLAQYADRGFSSSNNYFDAEFVVHSVRPWNSANRKTTDPSNDTFQLIVSETLTSPKFGVFASRKSFDSGITPQLFNPLVARASMSESEYVSSDGTTRKNLWIQTIQFDLDSMSDKTLSVLTNRMSAVDAQLASMNTKVAASEESFA